jgi:hypothetical protein
MALVVVTATAAVRLRERAARWLVALRSVARRITPGVGRSDKMARMMAKARWKREGWRFCCKGHDPNWYIKGAQRQREKSQWRKESW